jgi:chromosome segregation ATPase
MSGNLHNKIKTLEARVAALEEHYSIESTLLLSYLWKSLAYDKLISETDAELDAMKKERDELREELARLKARKVSLPYQWVEAGHPDSMVMSAIGVKIAIRSAGIAIEGEA